MSSGAYWCAATRAHVDEFIDGELGARESEGVESHLLMCGACREVFQRELDLKHMVRQACQPCDVPPDLQDRILLKISQLRVDLHSATFESLTIRARLEPPT